MAYRLVWEAWVYSVEGISDDTCRILVVSVRSILPDEVKVEAVTMWGGDFQFGVSHAL
jgi:hypothetical protein